MDRVLLARGASWSDKEVLFFLLSEAGVGGASGVEFEVEQCMKHFLMPFCLQWLVTLNLVLLVSVKYTSTTVDSGAAIGVLWLEPVPRYYFITLSKSKIYEVILQILFSFQDISTFKLKKKKKTHRYELSLDWTWRYTSWADFAVWAALTKSYKYLDVAPSTFSSPTFFNFFLLQK